jgi:hypothetical protein
VTVPAICGILRHNNRVKRRHTIRLASLLALLLGVFTPRASAFWQCEDRTCGTTPWFCCCVSPTDARDANCGQTRTPANDGSACPASCNCVRTLVVMDAARLSAAPAFPIPDLHPVMLCESPDSAAALVQELVVGALETRGPPPQRVTLTPPSLRAPPVS